MESFIAEKKVMVVTELDKKTPAGSDMVCVSFVDNTEEIMPKLRFELIKTAQASDLSGIQKTINEKIGSTLFSLLHEYGVKYGEIDGILDNCANLANAGFKRAQDVLFGFTQGDIPLIAINNVLLNDAREKKGNDDSSPEGGESNQPASN